MTAQTKTVAAELVRPAFEGAPAYFQAKELQGRAAPASAPAAVDALEQLFGYYDAR